eukprot:703536-Pleurochrysis_carterae.AAC.2
MVGSTCICLLGYSAYARSCSALTQPPGGAFVLRSTRTRACICACEVRAQALMRASVRAQRRPFSVRVYNARLRVRARPCKY